MYLSQLSASVLCTRDIELDEAMKPLQVLLIATAGVVSFYVAMHWARPEVGEADSVVEAVTRDSRPQVALKSEGAIVVPERDLTLKLPPRDRAVPESKGQAFTTLSWLPPPPPVRVVLPPPPPPPVVPVAPPLPFTFVGLMEQGSARPQAFLSKGEALLVVAAGDLLENNTYRVDTLNAQQIVITYLPLNAPQILNILGTMK